MSEEEEEKEEIIILTKRCSLTRVKLTALYKHIMTKKKKKKNPHQYTFQTNRILNIVI